MPDHSAILLNIYIPTSAIILGLVFAILIFVVVVLVEAKVMEKYYNLDRWERLMYSFLINLISTVLGIVLILVNRFSITIDIDLSLCSGPLVAFVLTVIVEYPSFLVLLWKRSPSYKTAAIYTLHTNVLSYAGLLAIVFVISFFSFS